MREQIKNILKQVLRIEHIKNDISQKTCANWDSLTHLNLIIKLEQQFDVSFDPEQIVEMTSLERIEKVIKSNT